MKLFTKLLLAVFFSLAGYNQLAAQPTITSFSPASGVVGTAVTLTGTNFNTTPANNIVFFGATKATVTAATATSLTVTVPVGATYAPMTVLNTGSSLAAYSLSNFTPTYSPNKTTITTSDFSVKQDFTTGTSPYSVAVGDLDGDGKPDLTVANYSSNTISVYRNTAISGSISVSSFAAKVDFATGAGPNSVAIGDLDGDGKPDLAVTNYSSNTISVLHNTATSGSIDAGSFETKVDFLVGSNPNSLAIGDLDGDGKPDLVATQGVNLVSVLRNTATSGSIAAGSFAARVEFIPGNVPFSVAIGDLDGDGKLDLAVACGPSTVSIFRNTATSGSIGAGSFAARVDFTTGQFCTSIAIGDLDGDGKPDLAVVNEGPYTVSVFRNTASIGSIGTGSFAAKVDFATGDYPYSIAIGDLDGDGKPDLAVVNKGSNTVSVIRNTATSGSIDAGSFAAKVDFATGTQPFSVAMGDLDGDGKPDLAVANNTSNSVSVLRQLLLSSNADLSALTLGSGTLSPSFAASTTAYTASVAVPNITVTPTMSDANASIAVNGSTVASGSVSGSIALSVGSNTITVIVTAQDASTKTYTLTVTRTASSNADLSELTTVVGTIAIPISPSFAAATTVYTASVQYIASGVKVTPTVADATATIQIQVNGGGYATVTSGSTSDISLNVGANPIDVKVTAQDGTTIKTYTITVTRDAASTNADLRALTITTGLITPTFVPGRTAYTVSVPYTTTFVRITPTKFDVLALKIEVRINGGTYFYTGSGVASTSLALNVGANTIDTKVTAEDGTTFKVYTITVTRAAASTNANLSALTTTAGTITPTFAAATTSYTASVTNATTSISVTPTKADDNASITVNGSTVASGSASGSIALNVGSNTITVVVTAQDASTKTYTITVTRAAAASTNANLSALTMSAGTLAPTFVSATTAYTASVGVSSLTVTPTVTDATATIQVRVNSGSYAAVTSGNVSSALSLNVGSNTIDIKVTAQDGTTIRTYTITVIRAMIAPGNALNFDGVDDNVSIPSVAGFGVSKVTIETWVYWAPTNNTDVQFICSKGLGAGSEVLEIHTGSTANALRFLPTPNVYIDVLNALPVGKWTHIAYVHDPSASYLKVYINGVEKPYTVTSGSINNALTTSSNAFTIGKRSSNAYYFKGSIDEFRLWNVVRTQADIQANMFSSISPSTTGLFAYYNFDNGIAGGTNTGLTTLLDQTANANNGTLGGPFALIGATSNWIASTAWNTWTGTTSNSFATATNWQLGTVPTTNDNMVIPTGASNLPVSITGTQAVNMASIQASTSATVTGTLKIAGPIYNSGTLTATAGTIELNGTAAQTITASTFASNTVQNLAINNEAGVTLGGALNITGTLTPTLGTLATSGFLTLKSDASGTARIAPVTGSITGNVTVERYIPAKSSRTWSMVASPFTQTISSGWQQQVHITGAGTGGTVCPSLTAHTNGFDATVSNAASMFVYDGTKSVGTRWTSITGTTAVSTAPGKGFRMNIRGPRSTGCSLLDGTVATTAAVTLSSTGTISNANKNAGSFTIALFNNGDASGANDNYMLTGNPYPSAISFSALQSANNTASGINNAYATFAPGNTVGNYAFWDGVSTFTGGHTGMNDATGNIIASGQAFFVQGKIAGAGLTLNWTESMKSSSSVNGYFRQAAITERLRIGYLLPNGTQADEIMIRFAKNANSAVLNSNDILSINTGTQNIKSLKAERGLAFNTRNSNFINDTVRLDVVSSTNGNFKLSFYDFDELVQQTNAKIYLIDNYTGTVQLMNTNKEYSFTVTTSIPATQGKERFTVVFNKPAPLVTLLSSSIKIYPNPVKEVLNVQLPSFGETYTLKLMDLKGAVLMQQTTQLANNTLPVSKLAAGIYMLQVIDAAGKKEVTKIVKN